MTLSQTTAAELEEHGAIPEIWRRYSPADGRVVVVRDRQPEIGENYVASMVRGPEGQMVPILGTQWQRDVAQQFEPWATVLMIGDARVTDWGTTINPPKKIKEGSRVLIAPTGGRDVELSAGEIKMTITVIPFEGIVLIDNGEEAAS